MNFVIFVTKKSGRTKSQKSISYMFLTNSNIPLSLQRSKATEIGTSDIILTFFQFYYTHLNATIIHDRNL